MFYLDVVEGLLIVGVFIYPMVYVAQRGEVKLGDLPVALNYLASVTCRIIILSVLRVLVYHNCQTCKEVEKGEKATNNRSERKDNTFCRGQGFQKHLCHLGAKVTM